MSDDLRHFAIAQRQRETFASQRSLSNTAVGVLIELVREVMYWHRDKESPDYNGCDTAPCHWCEQAQMAIDELTNTRAVRTDGPPRASGTHQPLVGHRIEEG